MQLYDYQQLIEHDVNKCWEMVKNVLAVLPTGGGKTVVFSKIIKDNIGPSVVIAHRDYLVLQAALTLAKFGISHKIIASKETVRSIVQEQVKEFGRHYYSPTAKCAVAGVKTLLNRAEQLKSWCRTVTLWVVDEAHHVQCENEWGRAVELFPNARGLGVTATPLRTDGGGLGRHAGGVFDELVHRPEADMRPLINRGFLTDYRIFAPPNTVALDMDGVNLTAKGEYSPKQTKTRLARSSVVGDVVAEYLKIAPGKVGLTFAYDIENANLIAKKFNDAGVPAITITGNDDTKTRASIIARLKRREILQLVTADLVGEGFDLPAIEVVSFARPTHSLGLYIQQFGRVLRLLAGKIWAIVIDHVGNIARHLLPDKPRTWTLDAREKRSKKKHDPDLIPLKTCLKCSGVFEAVYSNCPYCGELVVPGSRATPEEVDGDLHELDPGILAMMRGEIDKIDNALDISRHPNSYDDRIKLHALKKHGIKQETQAALRDSIRMWGGLYDSLGVPKSESWKRFYFRFGVDVMTAQALKTKEATELNGRIVEFLTSQGVMV